MKKDFCFPIDIVHGTVELVHGGGGRAMAQLIESLFVNAFDNAPLRAQGDGACLSIPGRRIAMATDSHVISPVFFPGGDIGSLAVNGTINDVAVSGGVPRYLASSFILEEGFLLSDLKKIVFSMAEAAEKAGVSIVTGDTKVVEKGKGDGIFITTTGIGEIPDGIDLSAGNIRPGDSILVSGTLGDHGVAVLSVRENLSFDMPVVSDSAALNGLTEAMLQAVPGIHAMRDPTRGGLAAVLNEFAHQAGVGMLLNEADIPVSPQVQAVCELLGLDPLYAANEGKLVAFCPAEDADRLLSVMRNHPLGRNAAIIGEVKEDKDCFVQMKTSFGGNRMVDWISGEQLPRIC